jgi:hypothetical protein
MPRFDPQFNMIFDLFSDHVRVCFPFKARVFSHKFMVLFIAPILAKHPKTCQPAAPSFPQKMQSGTNRPKGIMMVGFLRNCGKIGGKSCMLAMAGSMYHKFKGCLQ